LLKECEYKGYDMSRPRVFVSSTYYDLKHLRSSLDNFIDSLGFDSVLSEKGDITYSPDAPLDESCYREALNADIFVLIIGGRYGSSASTEEKKPSRSFFDQYNSITKKEYDSACSHDIPVYILIEQNVYSEYYTYLKNKDNNQTKYAHADSINIFQLIEDILSKPSNNPVFSFERFTEIESWLREQWAGLFRELLHQKQNNTHSTLSPEGVTESERNRLTDIVQFEGLKCNRIYRSMIESREVKIEHFKEALLAAKTFPEFTVKLGKISEQPELTILALREGSFVDSLEDINAARIILGAEPFLSLK